jgi:superfamily II DNA or RNA helicase
MTDDPTNETIMFGENKAARWYQIAALHGVEKALENSIRRILVVHPTGTGKTLTSGLIFSSSRVKKALGVQNRDLRLLFIAHKHRLLTQAEREYASSIGVEFIPHSAFAPLPKDIQWDIACIDEAHHEAMTTIQMHLEKMGDKPILGLTATPDRADGCLIKFETIINPITREQAVQEGYLAPTYLNSILDSNVRNKVSMAKMIIQDFGHEFGQTLMFFRTRNEVRDMTQYLVDKGYNAVPILDKSAKMVDYTLDKFSAGKIQFLINCNKLNEGIDVRGCTDLFLSSQYGSYTQLNQVIGRASRPDCVCRIWEMINPLSGRNLDTTVVVGTPERHRLLARKRGEWIQKDFDYVGNLSARQFVDKEKIT